jgi:hypothetical protein
MTDNLVNEYKKVLDKLDGKQSISIPIDIKQNGRYISEPVHLIVRGFLKFEEIVAIPGTQGVSLNQLEDKTVVYPVLFSSGTILVNNGRCVVVLLPRAEDLFEDTETVQIRADEFVTDDNIISQGGISLDEQIVDPEKEPVVIKIEVGKVREPYSLSIEVTVTSDDGVSVYSQTVDRGISPEVETTSDVKSLFYKTTKRIPSNFIVDCYNDSQWLPSVNVILGENESSKSTILEEINNLKNNTPLGISTMYDAVVSSSRILSDNTVEAKRKTIYVFTDNESNISLASLNQTVTEVNDISGDKQVPVLIGNMSVVDASGLSVKANRSDTKNINKLSFTTGGQSVTITDEDFIDDIVGIFYREAVGSMGYGTYEFIYDLGEEVSVNRLTSFFNIPTAESSATWSIETSLDGYNYTVVDDTYSHNEVVDLENLLVRYIRFKIILISGIELNSDEYGTIPEAPSLTSIEIIFNKNNVAYLYLNKEDVDYQPYHIVLAVDANEINTEQIKAGVAKSDSHNWVDYYTDSQPVVDQNGKVVIPIRFSQDTTQFENELLEKIDNFTLKTKYGSFDYFATVVIYDKLDNIISSDYYKLLPREGRVILNYSLPDDYQDGDYKIGIINSGRYKIGLKLTNKTESDTLDIYGVGHMYSTGKNLLPPVAKSNPEARDVAIIDSTPTRIDIIELSYTYYDSNFDDEDTNNRKIKWYIDGQPIPYLDNLIKWNDINDPLDPVYQNTSLTYPTESELGESSIENWMQMQTNTILQASDHVYAEIQVSDGTLVSDKVNSDPVTIIELPPVLGQITVMAEDDTGNVVSRITTNTRTVIYPPINTIFSSDSDDNQSEIVWYVEDEIFKRGIYGEERGDGQAPIHEIWINEVGSETYRDYGLRIANNIFVQVTPQTGNRAGETITSPVVVVQNDLPRIYGEKYIDDVHPANNDILISWVFDDFEMYHIGDMDTTGQFDQTGIKWYRKNLLDNEFTLVYSYNDQDSSLEEVFYVEEYRGNISTNLGSHISSVNDDVIYDGQQWYAVIIPHDSLDPGLSVTLPTITITPSGN